MSVEFEEWWQEQEFSENEWNKEPCRLAWNAAIDLCRKEASVQLNHTPDWFNRLLESHKVEDRDKIELC